MVIAHPLTPYLFTGLIGLAYLRRIAANFGRQPWRPVRTGIRLALLSLALVGLLFAAAFVPKAGLAVGIGLLAGATLAGFALRHNHADIVDGKPGYTPNPWIGGALSLLLVGRLLWRYAHVDVATMTSCSAGFGQQASPLTLGIAATRVAFYVVNSAGLFVQMRRLAAASDRPFINP
jgi:hypothetical protein